MPSAEVLDRALDDSWRNARAFQAVSCPARGIGPEGRRTPGATRCKAPRHCWHSSPHSNVVSVEVNSHRPCEQVARGELELRGISAKPCCRGNPSSGQYVSLRPGGRSRFSPRSLASGAPQNRRVLAHQPVSEATWVHVSTRVAHLEDRRGATMPPSASHDD